MLSFDITDRNIRVVKGTESNGKIKISSAANLNVEENLIVNGHVKDVPNVATLINAVLKTHKMPDKEAIVSISSNLTIFKEMNVAKVKTQDLQKVVKQQMQAELNLDDSYSVSYIIVGDAENTEGGEPAYRILATACPFEIVNSYREVFKLLGISLRSVMIGCNCITKVLLADTKIRSKMPLLAVQIDNNFISLNLYEQGSLSFSRFASIDAADYGYSDDYVFEAVNENIFRMLQFHRSRNTGETIENVIFYGDTHEYVRLTDELEKLDLKTSLINVPPQIHGHENLEFSLYANAIGAMFKRNKDTEKINLLETDLGAIVRSKVKNDNSGNIVLLGALAAALLIVGGTYLGFHLKNKSVEKDITEAQDFIDSPSTKAKLDNITALELKKDQAIAYQTQVQNARAAYDSQPVIRGRKFDILRETAKDVWKKVYGEDANGVIQYHGFQNGIINFDLYLDVVDLEKSKDYARKFPAEYVDALLQLKEDNGRPTFRRSEFRSATLYPGYNIEKGVKDPEHPEREAKDQLHMTLNLEVNGETSAAADIFAAEEEAKKKVEESIN
ncbi:MAG: pilus assembly protein PilM [Ruminococcus sp.]|nr:pilus assembly protein PilM [Ruminococcus sp.]